MTRIKRALWGPNMPWVANALAALLNLFLFVFGAHEFISLVCFFISSGFAALMYWLKVKREWDIW